MKIKHLSASRLKTYLQCSLQYHATYELDVPDQNVHPITNVGKAVHKAMEVSTRCLVADKFEDYFDPRDLLPTACKKDGVTERKNIQLAERCTESAIRMGWFDGIDHTRFCEQRLFCFLPDTDIQLCVVFDRFDINDRKAYVHDLKAGRIPPLNRLKQDWQPRAYNVATWELFGDDIDEVELWFWYLRSEKILKLTMTRGQAEADAKKLSRHVKKIIEDDDPKASVSRLCEWCRYRDLCDDYKKSGD